MHSDAPNFLQNVASPLAAFYLASAAANAFASFRAARARTFFRAGSWFALAILFAALATASLCGAPPEMPESAKLAIDGLLGPVTFTLGSLAFLTLLYLGRRWFVQPSVAWGMFNASLVFMGLSLTDPEFAAIVLRPDNVPIVAMVYLLGFFTWLGAAQATVNDDRRRAGRPPVEDEYRQTTLVWPDLVYIELISMVVITVVLVVWSIVLPAPLEQPANPAVTPNPSKAPWYFLGLQEMLVFFDPSVAGVILPALIIFGLAAIPYLDISRGGSGYYSIAQRKPVYLVFLFGFLQLWILLILIGTFFRGPNWNFFGLYEPRDPHRVLAMNNVRLSEYFWTIGLGRGAPQPPREGGTLLRLAWIAWREIAGLVLLGLYFVGLPIALARTVMARHRRALGRSRYWIVMLLLLMMLALPLKMILRWTANLSYVVSIPEYFFNF